MLAVTYNGKIYSVDVQKMDNISPSLNNKTHPPSLIQPTLLTQPLSQNSISQINDEMIKTIKNDIKIIEGPVYASLLQPKKKLYELLKRSPPVLFLLGDIHTAGVRCKSNVPSFSLYANSDRKSTFLTYMNKKAIQWQTDLYLEQWLTQKRKDKHTKETHVTNASLFNTFAITADCLHHTNKSGCDYENIRMHGADPRQQFNNISNHEIKYTADAYTDQIAYIISNEDEITKELLEHRKKTINGLFPDLSMTDIIDSWREIYKDNSLRTVYETPLFTTYSRTIHELKRLNEELQEMIKTVMTTLKTGVSLSHEPTKPTATWSPERRETMRQFFDALRDDNIDVINRLKKDITATLFPVDEVRSNGVDMYTISRILKNFKEGNTSRYSELSIVYLGRAHIKRIEYILRDYYDITQTWTNHNNSTDKCISQNGENTQLPSSNNSASLSPRLQSINSESSLSSNKSASPPSSNNLALATQRMTEAATEYNKAEQAMKKDAVKYGPLHGSNLWTWFNKYFGVNENQTPIKKGDFKAYEIINNVENSLIDLENISFKINDKSFAVGDFSCLPLPALKEKTQKLRAYNNTSKLTYQYIHGDISDIIHKITENDIVVVQAASQFNLLEMPSPEITPAKGIANYIMDNTQGPRVALSSPAGTLFRNYAVWNGTSQINTQINTLIDVMKELGLTLSGNYDSNGDGSAPAKIGQYSYVNGYLYINPFSIQPAINLPSFQKTMDDKLRVGIQWNTPSIHNPNIKLCQVYSSGLPLGGYLSLTDRGYMIDGIDGVIDDMNIDKFIKVMKNEYYPLIKPFAIALFASTFKCTLQAGVIHALRHGKESCTVYLTAVGGGVFGNPHEWIKEGLLIALEEFKNFSLNVKMVWFREKPPQYGDNEFNKYSKPNSNLQTGGTRRTQRKQKRSKPTRRIKR